MFSTTSSCKNGTDLAVLSETFNSEFDINALTAMAFPENIC
jgi:hypothetical protein